MRIGHWNIQCIQQVISSQLNNFNKYNLLQRMFQTTHVRVRIVQRTRMGKTCTETETETKSSWLVYWGDKRALQLGSSFWKTERSFRQFGTAIWNEIFEEFKGSYDKNERTFSQVKEIQQNLKYEFKQLKLKASKTGEEGLNDINENSPYYSIFLPNYGLPRQRRSRPDGNWKFFIYTKYLHTFNKRWCETRPRWCARWGIKEEEMRKSEEANAADDWNAFKEMWEISLH